MRPSRTRIRLLIVGLVAAMVPLGAPSASQAEAPAPAQQEPAAACQSGFAGPYPCRNIDLMSFLPIPALGLGNGNDIWGWTDPETGKEYAIMGTSTTTAFIDVSDPENPVVVGTLPRRGLGRNLLWGDVKVNDNHAFIVSEISGSGLQVFDLTRLRDAAPGTVFTDDAFSDEFSSAHNIVINPETDTAYPVGTRPEEVCGPENGGLLMMDISDPLNPTRAGCALVPLENNNYVHDAQCVIYHGPDADYRNHEICFGANEEVVAIYDVTDKANPKVISLVEYPTASYTHQGWLTGGHSFFLFGDELDELAGEVPGTTTYIMDVSDLDDPPEPKAFVHDNSAIDHNLYIHGNFVYQSNYTAGLRILQFDPVSLAAGELREVAHFDVFPSGDPTTFAGTWSNYRFPGSGITVVSSIENEVSGLFVLRPNLRCPGFEDVEGNHVLGTEGDDELRGTPGDDVICGLGGDDVIEGNPGDDLLIGGPGADRIIGGAGADEVRAGDGDDFVQTGPGKDRIWGDAGDDELRGFAEDDVIRGGPGADWIHGALHDDRLFGQDGDDRLRGAAGDNHLDGGPGTDSCRGGPRGSTTTVDCEGR